MRFAGNGSRRRALACKPASRGALYAYGVPCQGTRVPVTERPGCSIGIRTLCRTPAHQTAVKLRAQTLLRVAGAATRGCTAPCSAHRPAVPCHRPIDGDELAIDYRALGPTFLRHHGTAVSKCGLCLVSWPATPVRCGGRAAVHNYSDGIEAGTDRAGNESRQVMARAFGWPGFGIGRRTRCERRYRFTLTPSRECRFSPGCTNCHRP
jgi:hypothetical protein